MTIEYLSLFVSWVESFLSLRLHHLLHSSFLIQKLRWIRGSSRVDSLYSSSLEGSPLDGESFIFSCSHLLFSYYELSFFFFPESAESNHFLLAHVPRMNESHDHGRPFKVAITTSAFSASSQYCFKMLCILDLHILQLFSQIHLLNYVLIFK